MHIAQFLYLLISRFNIEESECFLRGYEDENMKPRGVKTEENALEVSYSRGYIDWPRGVYPRFWLLENFVKSWKFTHRGIKISRFPKRGVYISIWVSSRIKRSRKQNLENDRTIKVGFIIVNLKKQKLNLKNLKNLFLVRANNNKLNKNLKR